MTKDEVRLEILKLAHRHDRHPSQVVDQAKIYEAYVLSEKSDPLPTAKPEAFPAGDKKVSVRSSKEK